MRNAATGELLYDHSGAVFSRTASVMKVLTSAAALAVLGPDFRVKTTVIAGGGDITLAGTGSNIYRDAASLPDLAAQVTAALGSTPITSIVLDSSAFTGDAWQPSWPRKEQVDGYSSEVTALQIDGDRADPAANVSERSTDPVGRAGQAFVDALGAAGASVVGATVSLGTAPAGAALLGTVSSAPVSTMIPDALLRSDNTEAEMLARLAAKALGAGSSFTSLAVGIPEALATYGLDTTGLVIVDGSGLSDDNGVSPNFLTQLFTKINAREANLGVIADGLPVAGKTGHPGGPVHRFQRGCRGPGNRQDRLDRHGLHARGDHPCRRWLDPDVRLLRPRQCLGQRPGRARHGDGGGVPLWEQPLESLGYSRVDLFLNTSD